MVSAAMISIEFSRAPIDIATDPIGVTLNTGGDLPAVAVDAAFNVRTNRQATGPNSGNAFVA